MAFLVYGRNRRTGELVRRIDEDAHTEDGARRAAEALGVHVTVVVANPDREVFVHALAKPLKPEDKAAPDPVLANEAATFQRELREVTPNTPATYALVAINFAVFVAMIAAGVSIDNPKLPDLLHWGADFGPLVLGGEPWRLFTSMFVHIGFTHVASNMLVFAYVGPTVERMLGSAGFLVLYLIVGLAGSLWALYWSPLQVEAGASGAIFGIYAALAAILLRERNSIPPHVASKLLRFVTLFVIYNLVNSLQPGISMAAHVGGLVAGLVCGLAIAQPITPDAVAGRSIRNLAVLGAGMLFFGASLAGEHARYPNLSRLYAALQRFSQVELTIPKRIAKIESMTERENIDSVATALRRAGLLTDVIKTNGNSRMADATSAQMTGTALANAIEHEFLPAWRAVREPFGALKPIPAPMRADVAVILNYMKAREQNWQSLADAWRSDDKLATSAGERRTRELDEIARDVRRLPLLRLPLD